MLKPVDDRSNEAAASVLVLQTGDRQIELTRSPAPGLGADRTFASRNSAARGRYAAPSVVISHRFPAAGRALPCGIMAAACCLPDFAFGIVAVGLSRGISGRCARGGLVVRFLPRAALYEVGEDGADGGGFFDAGHDP